MEGFEEESPEPRAQACFVITVDALESQLCRGSRRGK